MDYIKYYKELNAQKQIDKLTKKCKNKKIVLYGAGLMTKILFENFSLSSLNIVAVCDMKFSKNSDEKFLSYNTISPSELCDFDFDIILINVLQYHKVFKNLVYNILINTKNESKQVRRLVEISLWFCLKKLLF